MGSHRGERKQNQAKARSSGTSSDHGHESASPSAHTISRIIEWVADVANLPYLVFIAFRFLTPIITNNGACDSMASPMTFVFHVALSFSCVVACLTERVEGSDGHVYYGIATFNGMILVDCPDRTKAGLTDLRDKKITLGDGVHVVLSLLVFGSLVANSKYAQNCLYILPKLRTWKGCEYLPLIIAVIWRCLYKRWP